VNEIPETPPLENNKIMEEILETLPQSMQNKSKIMGGLLTPFYTPAERGAFGITPEHEE
jgi:hypothetical protein